MLFVKYSIALNWHVGSPIEQYEVAVNLSNILVVTSKTKLLASSFLARRSMSGALMG